MNLLITGGTGSLGKEIVRNIGSSYKRVAVYSRDEAKHAEMKNIFPEGGKDGLRYFMGDVRDLHRLNYATKGSDHVIHAAAQKMIDMCEYNCLESVNTNVNGSINVIHSSIENNVKHCVLVSTDKAANGAVGVYGNTKSCAESVFIASNNYGKTRFNIVRYGNVLYSAKSVFYKWEKQAQNGEKITVSDPEATRFFWTLEEAARFVLKVISFEDYRGCIFVPKMRGFKMIDLAKLYSNNIKIVGYRCPEKQHEDLWSEQESYRCYEDDDMYIIYPHQHDWCLKIKKTGKPITPGFIMRSNYEQKT